MLLTLSTTHRPATDLGFLLMKHPDNVHSVDLSFGRETLFYPEASEEYDDKLKRHLSGRNVKPTHGLAETIEQLAAEAPEFAGEMHAWLDGLISHYVLDGGKVVVAHAGVKEEMQGRASGAVRSFCMYGETTGEIDEFGLPGRWDWAANYKGAPRWSMAIHRYWKPIGSTALSASTQAASWAAP